MEEESHLHLQAVTSLWSQGLPLCQSELDSSKVTHLLGCIGLVEGTHLLAASPGQPAGEGISPHDSYAFYFLSTLCFLTDGNCLITPGCLTTLGCVITHG